MNLEKSAAMQIVPDNRFKRKQTNTIYDIPAVRSYKYLGLEIDATLKFKEEIQKRKKLE